MLLWDKPKRLAEDSFFMLAMAAPSLAAIMTSLRCGLRAFRTNRHRRMAACLFLCAVSAIVAAWIAKMWIVDIVLDRHGSWSPLPHIFHIPFFYPPLFYPIEQSGG
jgi:hypothetical protein